MNAKNIIGNGNNWLNLINTQKAIISRHILLLSLTLYFVSETASQLRKHQVKNSSYVEPQNAPYFNHWGAWLTIKWSLWFSKTEGFWVYLCIKGNVKWSKAVTFCFLLSFLKNTLRKPKNLKFSRLWGIYKTIWSYNLINRSAAMQPAHPQCGPAANPMGQRTNRCKASRPIDLNEREPWKLEVSRNQ